MSTPSRKTFEPSEMKKITKEIDHFDFDNSNVRKIEKKTTIDITQKKDFGNLTRKTTYDEVGYVKKKSLFNLNKDEIKELNLENLMSNSIIEDEFCENFNTGSKLDEVIFELVLLKEENEKLKKKLENFEEIKRKNKNLEIYCKEMDTLNNELKLEIENSKENCEFEIGKYKEQNEALWNENQKLINEQLNNEKNNKKPENYESILEKNEEIKIENNNLKITHENDKIEWLQEKKFIESELKLAENVTIEAKLKYAEVATDKDYYHFKYKEMLKKIKNLEKTDSEDNKAKNKKVKSSGFFFKKK